MNTPNFNAILATFLAEIQELSNAILGVAVARSIDCAWGKQLDILGAWAGLPRNDVDDDVYRAAIKLQWYENNSSGQGDEAAYIAKQLCGASVVWYRPTDRGGSYYFQVFGGSIADPILAKLQAFSPVGVEIVALRRTLVRPFHCGDHCGQPLLHE